MKQPNDITFKYGLITVLSIKYNLLWTKCLWNDKYGDYLKIVLN